MSHPLLARERIDQSPEQYLRSVGVIFAEFGDQTQDSGNISYGVQIGEARFFIKTAGLMDNPLPYLDHPGRVALLRNAVRLNSNVRHPLLPSLLTVIESPEGPVLVYPWLAGELLGVPRERRDDPQSAFQRFRSLSAATILSCLDGVFDLHTELVRAGWIAVDFYDGSLLYDFTSRRLWVMDLDTYSPGPFRNEMGRMFGAARFMAPEEFELGARIDEQTTLFVMGRTALVFLSDGTLDAEVFRGSRALFDVAAQACVPERAHRFETMTAFYEAWQAARAMP